MKWIILLRSLPITQDDFLKEIGKIFCAVDRDGKPLQWDDKDEALSYMIKNYSINRARLAFIPEIVGDPETGYYLEYDLA